MKKAFYLFSVLCIVLFTSCDTNPCKTMNCNTGACNLGVCICPSGYSGINCQINLAKEMEGDFQYNYYNTITGSNGLGNAKVIVYDENQTSKCKITNAYRNWNTVDTSLKFTGVFNNSNSYFAIDTFYKHRTPDTIITGFYTKVGTNNTRLDLYFYTQGNYIGNYNATMFK
jgi:hypothetical protein